MCANDALIHLIHSIHMGDFYAIQVCRNEHKRYAGHAFFDIDSEAYRL
jgi:hypothetical protein